MGSIVNRHWIGTQVARPGLLSVARLLHDRGRRTLTILTYHRVLPSPDLGHYPFDPGVISASPEQFDAQMRWLRETQVPVPLSDVALYLRGRADLPPRAVVVTFDDGYFDNYEHAYPVLRRHGVPATMFLATDHIGNDRPFWFDVATYLAMRTDLPALRLDSERHIVLGTSPAERRAAARKLLDHIKTLPQPRVDELLARLCDETGCSIPETERAQVRTMRWEDVRDMATGGIEFGSHSCRHAILAHLPPDELRRELADSKRRIEDETGTPCTSVAYPVGRRFAYNDLVKREVGLAGYRLGLAYEAGVNRTGALDPFELRRQSVERDTDPRYFRSLTGLAGWFA